MAVIFYLSGSGDTLYAARRAAQAWDSCRVESMGAYLRNPYKVQDEEVGIFCPTYCFSAPPMVEKFITSLQIKPQYCFIVVTMGAKEGLALWQVQKWLAAKQITVDYAKTVMMPDNFFSIPKSLQQKLLNKAELSLTQLVTDLSSARRDVTAIKSDNIFKHLLTKVGWWGLHHVIKLDQMQVDPEKCIGCGLCAQICTMDNIHLVAGKPVFGNNCAHCLGCVHWCPQSAIRAGKIKVNSESRYVHPKIDPQMFR